MIESKRKKFSKAELNSWKAEISNDSSNLSTILRSKFRIKKEKDELQQNINELEAKKAELQRPNELNEPLQNFRKSMAQTDNLNFEVQQEIISMNDVTIPSPNMSINHNQNENEIPHYPSQVEPSPRTLIFDTKDLF